jgi:hypothetical protein
MSGRKRPSRRRPASDDDVVGYRHPPRAHRFKPGQSGNPNGRPKGSKNEATLMQDLLNRKIELNEHGKAKKITVLEGILRRIIGDCLKGNVKSTALLLNRLPTTAKEPDEADFGDDEKAVLEAYLRKYQSELSPNKDDVP